MKYAAPSLCPQTHRPCRCLYSKRLAKAWTVFWPPAPIRVQRVMCGPRLWAAFRCSFGSTINVVAARRKLRFMFGLPRTANQNNFQPHGMQSRTANGQRLCSAWRIWRYCGDMPPSRFGQLGGVVLPHRTLGDVTSRWRAQRSPWCAADGTPYPCKPESAACR